MKSKFQKGDRVILLTSDLPEDDWDRNLIAGMTGTVLTTYISAIPSDDNIRVGVCWDSDCSWLDNWWVDECNLAFECGVEDVSSEVAALL